jgi:hypothetical protein
VVIGDIGADVEAARAAGARGILVPTPVTRPEEIAAAPEVVRDLATAVDRVLATRPPAPVVPLDAAPSYLARSGERLRRGAMEVGA